MPQTKNASFEYPDDFSFWSSGAEKVKIINSEDFNIQDTMKWLGLEELHLLEAGMGNCSASEARDRLEVMEFLNNHPRFVTLLKQLIQADNVGCLSRNIYHFIEYYQETSGERTKFWQLLSKIERYLSKVVEKKRSIPAKLKTFNSVIYSSLSGEVESKESEMVDKIFRALKNSAIMQGVFNLNVEVSHEDNTAYKYRVSKLEIDKLSGFRIFSPDLLKLNREESARISLYRNFWRKVFLSWNLGVYQRSKYHHLRKRINDNMALNTESPLPYFREDIVRNLPGVLKKDRKLSKVLFKCGLVRLSFYFSYGANYEEGINVKLVAAHYPYYSHGFDLLGKSDLSNCYNVPLRYTHHYSLTPEDEKRLEQGMEDIKSQVCKLRLLRKTSDVNKIILNQYPNFESGELIKFKIPSPRTNPYCQPIKLEDFYESPEFISVYQEVKKFHSFVLDNAKVLVEMSKALNAIKDKAKELRTKICFAEIMDDSGNTLEVQELFPMHLRKEESIKGIVPIKNFPSVNGIPVGVSGDHASSKTTILKSLPVSIYLAQSGLPSFGKGLKINPKTHICLFLSGFDSEQSMFQSSARKLKNIFEATEDIEGRKVLVLCDELGAYTHAEGGIAMTIRVVEKLMKKQCSLVFSSQEPAVFEILHKKYGIICVQGNTKHKMSPGIGKGNPERIMEEQGLMKYLN